MAVLCLPFSTVIHATHILTRDTNMLIIHSTTISVYFANNAAQHQISWLTVTHKHQRFRRALSNLNLGPLNENASKLGIMEK
jgi:hypothetical protein